MLRRYLNKKVMLLCAIVFCVSCSRTDVTPAATIPASVPEPIGLTYTVQRGRLVRKVAFEGRIAPLEQVPLYFKTSGYVKQVYVRQGDQVKAGDLLAELETDELQNEIAQAEVALNSAQQLLSTAEKSLERQRALAELNLEVATTSLAQAEDANTYAISQAELALALAEEELARLNQAGDTNAYAIAQAELSLALVREELTRTLSLEETYTSAVVRARVGLERAQDEVARAEVEYREALDRPWEPLDVREAYARTLQQARWNLEIAQAQYDEAVANMEVYQSDLRVQGIAVRQAEEELKQLQDGADVLVEAHQSDLRIQEIAVEQALAELEQLKKGVDPFLALEVQRAQQELDWLAEGVDPVLVNDVNQARLALERLQGLVADAQIVAPADGEVVSLSLFPGRLVEAFKVGVVIADPLGVQVVADLSNQQLKALTEGQKATVVLDTTSQRAWEGTIRCLPYPYGTCGSADNLTGSENAVRISLEGDTGDLKIGALVQVSVVLQEKEDVLWLPPAAIRSYQDREFVIVQEGERQRRVDVRVGIRGQEQVEILEGLEEGQVVVAP